MADKKIVYKTFNTQIFAFLDEIIAIIPDEEIIKSKLYFETIRNLNPTLLIKVWYTYIEQPYQEKIQQGDLEFFLEKDYSKDLVNLHNAQKIMNTIDISLREPLKKMDSNNRDHCKDYIILLSNLSRVFNELN
jgi:hypothetical protein